MNSTTSSTTGQVDHLHVHRRNFPSTIEEAEAMLAASAIGDYRIETIGEWCIGQPKPLPDRFFNRFAASVAHSPKRFGRLFLYALRAATEGERDAG